jgi:predicted nuclease with TOPRIM domain
MKETEFKADNKIEVSVKQKKQQEYQLVDKIIPYPGHTIWKINNETLEIEKAKFINSVTFFVGETPKKEILIVEGHTYISALSKKTALKKFKNGKNGSVPMLKEPLKLVL